MRRGPIFVLLVAGTAAAQDPAKPPAAERPTLRLAKGEKVAYRFREVVVFESELRLGDGFKEKNEADTTWDLVLEGMDPRADGDVDVSAKWTRIVGKTSFLFGKNAIDTDAAKPVTGDAPQPSNTREARLCKLTKQASVVTLSPLGEVKAVTGPARVLLDFYAGPQGSKTQSGPLAEADLAATFQRWFPPLPDQKPRAGTAWKADRTLAPEMFTVIDLQTFGLVPEKLTAKSVKDGVLVASLASERKPPKKRPDEDRKDPPKPGPDEVRPPTLPVGEPWSWDLSGEVAIDLATGLYRSRRAKLTFTAGRWSVNGARAGRGTVETTLERVDAAAK
jgi:hypothetical protein